jgi:oligopeptidase A
MASPHPFLDDSFLVRWSTLTPDRIAPDITKVLEETTERLDAVCRTDRGRMTFETTLLAFEEALAPLHEAWGKVSHLDSVSNSPALREAYNEMLPKVSEFFARLYLNESLWDLFKTFGGTPEAAKLAGVPRRFFEETMADFRASGADLPADKKKRLEELEAELAEVFRKRSRFH